MAFNLRWTPWITPPLQFHNGGYYPEYTQDGVRVYGDIFPSALIGTTPIDDPMSWSYILGHPTATSAQYRPGGVYTLPAGSPVGVHLEPVSISPGDPLYAVDDAHVRIATYIYPLGFPGIPSVSYVGYDGLLSDLDMTVPCVMSPPGINTIPSALLYGVSTTDGGMFISLPLTQPSPYIADVNGIVDWLLQPPDVRFLLPIGTPPLHQRQRSDGLAGGGPVHARGNTRQAGLFQRGIL